MVGFKRLGRGAAWNGLQHRRFHFEEVALHQELANMGDHLRAHPEGVAHVFVDDQVDVTLTIALLGVGQAVVLVRQRTQRLGQQADVGHFHVQVALAGAGQGAFGGDDVAQVVVLDRFQGLGRQGLAVDVHLQAPGHVLQHHKGATVEDDTAGDFDRDGGFGQLFLGLVGVLLLQVVAVVITTEIIGEGIALLTHDRKLFLALGNQLVLFLVDGVLV